jgi:hypothetical protein
MLFNEQHLATRLEYILVGERGYTGRPHLEGI